MKKLILIFSLMVINFSFSQEEIIEIEEIEVVEEPDEPVAVTFAVVEEVPIFPGCENAEYKKGCFQEKVNAHVAKYLNESEIAKKNQKEDVKVYAFFIIKEDGSISSIKTRSPDKVLEAEAKRILYKLPKMLPGKQRGRVVEVSYYIPITFKKQLEKK